MKTTHSDPRDWMIEGDNGRHVKRSCRRPSSKRALIPLFECIFVLGKRGLQERRNITYTYRPRNRKLGAGIEVRFHERNSTWQVGTRPPTSDPVQAYGWLAEDAAQRERRIYEETQR